MKKFKNKRDALNYAIEQIKPSVIGLEDYNRFRQIRNRLRKDPDSVKENSVKSLFDRIGIKEKCTYYIDKPLEKH